MEIVERNGLFGVWARTPDESSPLPAVELDSCPTTRKSTRGAKRTFEQLTPPSAATGENVETSDGDEPPAEPSEWSDICEKRQILPYYYEWLNNERGAFTHHAFVGEEPCLDSLTPAVVSLPIDTFEVAGLAVVFTPKLDHPEINDVLTTLFQKLDNEFDKHPHDSKFLIVAPLSRRASWWKYTSRYEVVSVLKRGTYFYSTRERSYKDGGSRKKINSQQLLHAGLKQCARFYCDKTDYDIVILFRGVDTPVRVNPAMLFHLRLGHFSDKFARWVVEGGIDTGLDIKLSDIVNENCFCKACKSQRIVKSVKATNQDFTNYEPFEYVCMDGSGPMPFVSLHGNRYVWAVMCLRTRWVKLYFSKKKTQIEIIKIIRKYQAYVKTWRRSLTTFGLTAKLLTDLGGEFTGKEIERLLTEDGVRHIFAATAMHHQNAHVERLFRTIWGSMNKMMFTGDAPPSLWEELCTHVVFIRNRLGYAALDWQSPFFLCEGRESHDFKRLKIFYSPCWPVTDAYYNKFSATIQECKWVGLSEEVRGTIVYRPSDEKVFTAGMLTTFENPTDVGKLLNDRNLTAFDIQDSSAYKNLINVPRDLVEEPCVRSLTRIVSSRPIWHEDDEEHYALLQIISRRNSPPYWIKLSALNNSEDGKFFKQIYDFVLGDDTGTSFPLFALVTVVRSDGAVPMPGVICAYNKRSSFQFQVALEDGSIQYFKSRQIREFKEGLIYFSRRLSPLLKWGVSN